VAGDKRPVTLQSEGAPQGHPYLVFCSVADGLRRRRLESSLRSVSDLRWFPDFSHLTEALKEETRRVHVAVFDVSDSRGASASGLARGLSERHRGIGLVAYRSPGELTDAQLCALGAAGVHDTLLQGTTDEGFTARTIILDASRRGAAEIVLAELCSIVPRRLHIIAEYVIRDPGSTTVAAISRNLDLHRQTISGWCRKEQFLRAEELVIWCRLLFVAALLEFTNRTLESIANELEYSSATALRNQLKRYTGHTATTVRAKGLEGVATLFRGRVAQQRAGFGGQPGDSSYHADSIAHLR
jgi:AraC-like DNA-binding protein